MLCTDSSLAMVDSIASTTSVILPRRLYRSYSKRDISENRRLEHCRLPNAEFMGQRLVALPNSGMAADKGSHRRGVLTIWALAAELTKEAYLPREDDRISRDLRYTVGSDFNSARLWPPSNRADNPALHNPLLRQERMGCGWLGAIFEWEGVIVEDDPEIKRQAWLALSEEEGKPPPPAFILKRIEGMKSEQAISEVLCWSRDPSELRRMASRKEDIHRSLQRGFYELRPGSQEFICTLMNHNIPIAVTSTRPRKNLQEAMAAVGIQGSFNAIVTAEDVYRGKPDPEMFIYAAQLLNFIPERCIVFGNSNSTVEAAHDVRMKCVAVASKHPLYELSAADLVVRRLSELTIVDLKNLAAIESPEFGNEEPEPEMEEEEGVSPSTSVATDDFW